MEPLSRTEVKLIFDFKTFLKEAVKLQPMVDEMEKEIRSFNFDINSLKYYQYNKKDFESIVIRLSSAPNDNDTYYDAKILYLELSLDFYRLEEVIRNLKQYGSVPGTLLKVPKNSFSQLKIVR